jgi:hypothetical protein
MLLLLLLFGTERCQKGGDVERMSVTTSVTFEGKASQAWRCTAGMYHLCLEATATLTCVDKDRHFSLPVITGSLVCASIKNIPSQEHSFTKQSDPEVMLKT